MTRVVEKLNRVVALLVMVSICACTMSISGPEALSERMLISRSARLMDLYIDEVASAMTEDELPGFKQAYERGFSAEDVARRTLGEEGGRRYLEFTLYANDYQNVDEVLSAASEHTGDIPCNRRLFCNNKMFHFYSSPFILYTVESFTDDLACI